MRKRSLNTERDKAVQEVGFYHSRGKRIHYNVFQTSSFASGSVNFGQRETKLRDGDFQ